MAHKTIAVNDNALETSFDLYQIIAHEVEEVNVLEHKKMETDFTLAKTDLLESRLKLKLNIKSLYVGGQKPFSRFIMGIP